MLETICDACQYGEHDKHRRVIQAPPPGMLGGMGCRCKGECVDGRYCPPQLANTLEAIWKRHEASKLMHSQPEPIPEGHTPPPSPFVNDSVTELTQELYHAWVIYEHQRNIAHPRWFALRDDLKQHWRQMAQTTLDIYKKENL
ncbi:MAG TPA: hypothetical protein VN843_34450 [Anaerolineales bacterium]|nr:hypothetical protein [Anaerolineales bacterium]